MRKARYIGNSVFRYGSTALRKGDCIAEPQALVDALLERGDFEPAEDKPAKKKKKSKNDDPTIEIATEDE